MTFVVRTVRVAPGGSLPYEEEDWRGALVVVVQGEILLETSCGRAFHFRRGDLLWFEGLPLVRLRNEGEEPALLRAAARVEAVR